MQKMWVRDPQALRPGAGGFSPSLRTLKALGLNTILSPQGVKRAIIRGVRGSNPIVSTVETARGIVSWFGCRRQGERPVGVFGGIVSVIA